MINFCIYRLILGSKSNKLTIKVWESWCQILIHIVLLLGLLCIRRHQSVYLKRLLHAFYMLYSVVVVFANSVPTAVKPTLGCTSWCCWRTCRLWALRTVKAARSHSKRECCQFCLSAEQDFTVSSCPTFQESTSQVNEQCLLNSLLLL